jgi:hypothetical protein
MVVGSEVALVECFSGPVVPDRRGQGEQPLGDYDADALLVSGSSWLGSAGRPVRLVRW